MGELFTHSDCVPRRGPTPPPGPFPWRVGPEAWPPHASDPAPRPLLDQAAAACEHQADPLEGQSFYRPACPGSRVTQIPLGARPPTTTSRLRRSPTSWDEAPPSVATLAPGAVRACRGWC